MSGQLDDARIAVLYRPAKKAFDRREYKMASTINPKITSPGPTTGRAGSGSGMPTPRRRCSSTDTIATSTTNKVTVPGRCVVVAIAARISMSLTCPFGMLPGMRAQVANRDAGGRPGHIVIATFPLTLPATR